MATARDLVERAYRKIGVVASDEAMTADQADVGLDTLNMMLSAWALDGIDIAHNDLALADQFPLDARFHEGTVYMLAERLAPEFSRPVTFNVRKFRDSIAAYYLIVPDVQIDRALLRTPSQWRRRR